MILALADIDGGAEPGRLPVRYPLDLTMALRIGRIANAVREHLDGPEAKDDEAVDPTEARGLELAQVRRTAPLAPAGITSHILSSQVGP